MSAVVDVGDALELTFLSNPGATVEVSWLDPDLVPVIDAETVPEASGEPAGRYPYTFVATTPGVWTAHFVASGAATAVERYHVRAVPVVTTPPLAAVGDVVAQYGPLTAAQEGLTAWLLRQASTMVRSRRPDIDTQIAAGDVDRDMAALAVANMVLRVLRNPRGLRAETTGPFSRTYDTTHAAGLLVITADEVKLLNPTPDAGTSGTVGVIYPRPALAPVPVYRGRGWPDGWC